jgi:hypothetical protein
MRTALCTLAGADRIVRCLPAKVSAPAVIVMRA